MTAAEFKIRQPAFSNADNALVDQHLETADALCPSTVWTNSVLRNRAIELTAAQSLAIDPAARDMQLSPDGTTHYDRLLDELRRVVAGGPRTIL